MFRMATRSLASTGVRFVRRNFGTLSPQQVSALRAEKKVLLIDVREPQELELASIKGDDVFSVPVSRVQEALSNDEQLSDVLPEAAKPDAQIVCFCHHGVRSANVAGFLECVTS